MPKLGDMSDRTLLIISAVESTFIHLFGYFCVSPFAALFFCWIKEAWFLREFGIPCIIAGMIYLIIYQVEKVLSFDNNIKYPTEYHIVANILVPIGIGMLLVYRSLVW